MTKTRISAVLMRTFVQRNIYQSFFMITVQPTTSDNKTKHFDLFRRNTIGINRMIDTPYGPKRLLYADWTASGRLYGPIEEKLAHTFGELVGNTHSEASTTGTMMTYAYHYALELIKKHVHAGAQDVLLPTGSGMTGAVNKLQRIMGLRLHEQFRKQVQIPEELRPVVFVTHMEHHSNQTSWIETLADVVVLKPDENGLVDLDNLRAELLLYKNRQTKIGAFTSCSNVTGIHTPYHEMARIMHEHGGYCFVDFAASAPYIDINMHPEDPMESLDAIYFSPHKFLGGPGSTGVLILNSALYHNYVPDNVGGGVVDWTNPWGEHKFVDDIEAREDAGTPAFLQTIRAALSIEVKNAMQVDFIHEQENWMVETAFNELEKISNLQILAGNVRERLGFISFYIDHVHYNLVVKILNDYYGIQSRGGCSCAGTYGHYLLHVSRELSDRITSKINHGDNSEKPGWIRISFHPTMLPEEILFITNAISEIAGNIHFWEKDYVYDPRKNEFFHVNQALLEEKRKVKEMFLFT